MNKYQEEFKEMLHEFVKTELPKSGKYLFLNMNELKKLNTFVKKVCEKAEMYDELKTPIRPLNDIHGKAFCKCGESVYYSRNNYCNKCGTKMDWSEKDED